MKKNDSIELMIEDMGTDGEGIGHVATEDGRSIAVFVKDAVMGDTIRAAITKVKKQYVYARLVEVIKPSPYRVEPKCPVARPCGGCTLQHVSYEKQLDYKWNKVKNCLSRIGGIEHPEDLMEPIIGMENPWNYRNKAQFPVGRDKDGKEPIRLSTHRIAIFRRRAMIRLSSVCGIFCRIIIFQLMTRRRIPDWCGIS